MILEHGKWLVDDEMKKRDKHKYYVCKHKFNPCKVELVFVRFDGLHGEKELCEFVKKLR